MMRALTGALEDPGPVRTRSLERALATESLQRGCARGLPLAWESIAGPTVEGARARTGPGDPRGRGQRSLSRLTGIQNVKKCSKNQPVTSWPKRLGEICGLALAAAAVLGTRSASTAELDDHLRYRWYQVEVLVFAHDPAFAAEQNFSTDGIAARQHLLDGTRYPLAAFALAELPDSRRVVSVGRPPPVDDAMPFVVSNLVPPAWFAGECVMASWTPPAAQTFDMLPIEARDPCLPPDPWVMESAGIELAMDPGPLATQEVEPDAAPEPDTEADLNTPARPALTLEEINTAIADYENDLLRSSYVWRRETPKFAGELSQLRRRYEVIAAGSWHQPVPPREAPQPLLLQVGAMEAERAHRLEGLLSVTRGRYVHFHVLLRFRLQDGGTALLAEQRRMRTDEPHYLDHPALGILVRVDPLIPPDALLALFDEFHESRDKP